MTIRFVRFGDLVGSFGRPKETFVENCLENTRRFFNNWEDLVDDYREQYARQWLVHRPPEGVRGVYAFVEGIINRSLLPGDTHSMEPNIFEALDAVWAKFGPDGADLPIGEWMRYSTTDEIYLALVARGDSIISEHDLDDKTWPWDVVSDHGAEFFIEM